MNAIEDALSSDQQVEVNLEFQTFASCQEMDEVLKRWLEEVKDYLVPPIKAVPLGEDVMIFDTIESVPVMEKSVAAPSISKDYSKTNVQVA